MLNLNDYDGLVFYSLFQLPVNEDNRKLIYNKIIRKKKTLHFAVENLILKTKSDQSKIEEIFKIKIAQAKNNKNQKLGKLKNYLNINHNKVKRDYLERMNNKKVICMKKQKNMVSIIGMEIENMDMVVIIIFQVIMKL